MNEIYLQLIEKIVNEPQYISSPRGQKIKELTNVVLHLDDPTKCLITLKDRKLNYRFGIIEKFEFASGSNDVGRILAYNSKLSSYLNSNQTFDANYSERFHYWFAYIIGLLTKDPDSRQAVISLYGTQDRHDSKDIPCTLTLQFMIREGKLNLIVNMRSNDVLWGVPYDVQSFCFIQEMIAACLKIPVGYYAHHVGSMHIYESTEQQLIDVLNGSREKYDHVLPQIEWDMFDGIQNMFSKFWTLEYEARVVKGCRMHELDSSHLPIWMNEYIIKYKL